jgi:CDP-diacylglycerol--glycerol-3-phosphate 3-phosphatidyltransferase
MQRHLPNAVTLVRGLCGPLIAAVILWGPESLLPFWLFLAAISTDLVDGALARRLGVSSDFGVMLDATADKVLTGMVWLALWGAGWTPWWMSAIMVFRDVTIGVMWFRERDRGVVWHPNLPGRLMVTFEGIALPVLLFRVPWLDVRWESVGVALGALSLALGLLSASIYARQRFFGQRVPRDAI